jgi:hypothetical protein
MGVPSTASDWTDPPPLQQRSRPIPGRLLAMIKPCSHFLVALRPVRDLLLCAKHLFAAAKWQLPAAERSRTRNGTSSGLNYEQDFAASVVTPGCPRLKCAGVPMAPLLRCTGVTQELIAEPGANEAGRPYFSLPPSRRCHITVSVRPQPLPSRSNLLHDWLGSARIPRHRKIYGPSQQIAFRSKPIISAIMQRKSNAA